MNLNSGALYKLLLKVIDFKQKLSETLLAFVTKERAFQYKMPVTKG